MMSQKLPLKPYPYIIHSLKFKDSFEQLTEEEKLYAYYLSQASWSGQLIDLFLTSYEAPALFIIFQTFFTSFPSFSEIKSTLLKKEITDINYSKFLLYASEFYSNFGNFNYLKKKIIPELLDKEFEAILKVSPKFQEKISSIWELIKSIIYDNSPNICTINLEENNGKNSYYFGGIKAEQIKKIDEKLIRHNISLLNTRLFMLNSNRVAVLIGSKEEKQKLLEENKENSEEEIILLKGEYSSILKEIIDKLEKAKNYALNDCGKEILDDYINFFTKGEIDIHKDSQRKWVKNSLSSIDFNLGWIEPFNDPMGERGFFECWVGIKDVFQTQKYTQLINLYPDLIKELPWDENFEKEEHNTVEISAFDVIYFGRSLCPNGKCLPKYKDVRDENGVKILSFVNAFSDNNDYYLFCEEKDNKVLKNFGRQSVYIVSTCKELVGHCTGKFFRLLSDETETEQRFNFDPKIINPLTGKTIEKYYKKNETFEKKFGSLSSVIDECRAESIGLFFGSNVSVQELFHLNEDDNKVVSYTMWLLQFLKGILGLNMYNEDKKEWQNPLSQAFWIFTTFILKNQLEGEEIIKVDLVEKEGANNIEFHINVNREMIVCCGNEILAKLILKLHIWKCIGDVDSAKTFIQEYSTVDEKFLKIKKLIDKNEIPKKFFLYNNLEKNKDGTINYIEYQEDLEGIVESNIDRYKTDYNDFVYEQWVKYATNFIKV